MSGKPSMPAFSFGDLVVVHGAPGVAIVAEVRRADCRAQYLLEGRSVWAEFNELRRAREDETAGSIDLTVRDLLVALSAHELEFTTPAPGRARLVASHGAIGPDTVDRLRGMLGIRLTRFVIRPQGMHRIQTILELTL